MTLWVNDDSATYYVINDLLDICPDDNLAIEIGAYTASFEGEEAVFRLPGKVHFGPYGPGPLSYVAKDVLLTIINNPHHVFVRGETTGVDIAPDIPLSLFGGVLISETVPAYHFNIIYDVDDCFGQKLYFLDVNGEKTYSPPFLNLFHELCHAKYVLAWETDPDELIQAVKSMALDPAFVELYGGNEIKARSEIYAIRKTNQLGATFGYSPRAEDIASHLNWWCGNEYHTHELGEMEEALAEPEPIEEHVDETGFIEGYPEDMLEPGCFVATAAYDSPVEPDVAFLRAYRDNILRKTRTGKHIFDDFFNHYHRFSPIVVGLMKKDERIKDIIRWALVSPIIEFFRIGYDFPDGEIESLNEPWKSYISNLQRRFEEYGVGVLENLGNGLPKCFLNLSKPDAAREIGLLLKLVLRRQESRNSYLSILENLKQIPLKVSEDNYIRIRNELLLLGRSESEIKRILKVRNKIRTLSLNGNLNSHGCFIELGDILLPNHRIYKLHLENQTSVHIFQTNILFGKNNLIGDIVREYYDYILPGERKTFLLCPSAQLAYFSVQNHWIDEYGNQDYLTSRRFYPYEAASPIEATITLNEEMIA